MTDDTVPVPRVLVEALREAVDEVNTGERFVSALLVPANALVDAADSPPVDEPLCRCGHAKTAHLGYSARCFDCKCQSYRHKHEWERRSSFGDPYRKCVSCGAVEDVPASDPPAPSPSTREPVPTRLTDEEAERLHSAAWERFGKMPSSNPGDFVHALIPVFESIVAARLSASTDRAERDEWQAIAERNGVRWCACSRAARRRDEANPVCPLHGTPMVQQRDALAAKLEAVKRLADEWDDAAYAYRESDPLHHVNQGHANQLRAAVQSVQETE